MPITLSFELKAEYPNNWFQSRAPGINVRANSLLATRVTGAFDTENFEFYESLDDGDTWTKISELPVSNPHIGCRMLNLTDNTILLPVDDFANNQFSIYVSADDGHTWTNKKTYPNTGTPTSLIASAGAQSYNRGSAVVAGFINRAQGGGHDAQLTWSTDQGNTWTDSPNIVLSTMQDLIFAIANAGNGTWLAANERNWIYRSTDYGQTWSSTPQGELPLLVDDTRTWCCTFITPQIALAAGRINSPSDHFWPYLYRSTDAGQTWTHIPASAIATWPDSDYALGIREVHRLTRDGAIMGIEETRGRDFSPWRASFDQGQTWSDCAQVGGHPSSDNSACNGAIAVDKKGNIWSVVDARREPEQYAQIWKGTLS